jgi:hypothetical protein
MVDSCSMLVVAFDVGGGGTAPESNTHFARPVAAGQN